MKKFLILLLVTTLVLVGCGKKDDTEKDADAKKEKDVITSSTCRLEEDGMNVLSEIKAKNDIINYIDVAYTVTAEFVGINSFEELDEDTKKEIKDEFIKGFGLEKGSYEGIEVNVETKKDMVFKITIDLNKADKEVLKQMGYDFEDLNMSLENGVEELEQQGFTCSK